MYRQLLDSLRALYNSRRFLLSIAWIIMAVGVVLRVVQYMANRSFWVDEVFLALNLRDRTFAQLMTPLSYEQQAPIGFLFLEKVLFITLGDSEFSLRLVALAAGLISIPLFFNLTKHFLSLRGRVLAMAFFSLSDTLIYYSSELKPYTVDLLAALCVYEVLLNFERRSKITSGSLVLLGLVGIVAVWFSLPSSFVLFGVGSVLLFVRLRKQLWVHVRILLGIFSLWIVSFAIHFILSLWHYVVRYTQLWESVYIPFPPRSPADIGYTLTLVIDAFSAPVGVSVSLLGFGFFCVGVVVLLQHRRKEALLLLAPIAATVVASILHRYPFADRFLIFLSPVAFIVMTMGIGMVIRLSRSSGRPALMICAVILIGYLFTRPLTNAGYFFVVRHKREDVKPLLAYLQGNMKEGDVLYLYYGASYAFNWYMSDYALDALPRIVGGEHRENIQGYKDELENLKGNRRVWVLFSHNYTRGPVDEHKFFVRYLDALGNRTDEHHAAGASLYLYDIQESDAL